MTTDTKTAALLHALADLIDEMAELRRQPPRSFMEQLSSAVCSPDEEWDRIPSRLRAHADSLAPGLPEGWVVAEPSPCTYFTIYTANGPDSAWVTLTHCRDGEAFWQCRGTTPLAVYAYLLARAQGVGS